MSREKFYLIFSDAPAKRIQINEPVYFGDVDFNLDQRENGMGRDVSLSGGSVKFKFTVYRHDDVFDKILYFNHFFGFESDVKIVIVLENGDEFIGELDFQMAETNDFNYFECPVILESKMQIFRRRSETKVDLFSSVSIDGEAIAPLQPINMLLQAKPSIQVSKWTQATPFEANILIASPDYFNITQSLVQSEINNSFVPFIQKSVQRSDMQIIEADSNLANVKLSITNLDIYVQNGSGDANISIRLVKTTGDVDNLNPDSVVLYSASAHGDDISLLGDLPIYDVGSLQRGEKLYLYMNAGTNGFARAKITKCDVTLTASSTAYNSVTPTFRLIDVMKQVALSISGLEVYAPRYDLGGQFYDTVLTSGKLLGANITDPFYVSWEDIEKSIRPENNADSEIQLDKRVFVGIEKDFYTTDECGFFDNTQFSGMIRKANPIYCLNEFKFKYAKYQSLKENIEPNSDSTIHGESILTPFNQKVENSKECSVQWNRDSILLDVQQRLSTIVSKDTATQEDDTVFAIDTIPTEGDRNFTESTTLQHSYSPAYLSLRNKGDVNFIVLGIRIGTTFKINYPDPNNGDYQVYNVSQSELQLIRMSGGTISNANDGIRLTKYIYEIKQETIPITNRTNQDFTVVLNLISPELYSNLRYSVERNIRNYWNSFLATVNLYRKDKVIKNTFYKNNGKCETEYNGLRIIEKEDFIPTDPIVTPYMYDNVIFANVDFADFIELQRQIRTKRGFIRTIDNNRRALKLYPIKMSYENKSRQLTISGQEKFEKAYLTIVKQNGIITINDETKLRKVIYDPVVLERDKKVLLFDTGRQILYNGVFWDKVSINNATAPSIEILKEWLSLL